MANPPAKQLQEIEKEGSRKKLKTAKEMSPTLQSIFNEQFAAEEGSSFGIVFRSRRVVTY